MWKLFLIYSKTFSSASFQPSSFPESKSESLSAKLPCCNFINSIRGREGGYELSKPSSKITIYDITQSFKDIEDETKCILGIGKCDKNNKCVLHNECFIPRDSIREMYKNTTLDKFTDQNFKM